CIDFIEQQLFLQLVAPDEVAAIVVEPIQGEGGYIVPPDSFLQRLRAIATQHGIQLIVDEVQSGMGRTGKMFAIEHASVAPGIVTFATARRRSAPPPSETRSSRNVSRAACSSSAPAATPSACRRRWC